MLLPEQKRRRRGEKMLTVPRTFLLLLLFSAPAEAQWWRVQTSGIDTNLRGVGTVPNARAAMVKIVWASGSNGVILKSTDKGETWSHLHVAGGDSLDFRGIVAFSDKIAYVMSSGEGDKSRIYKTTDGGKSWRLQYSDKRKEFFLDSIACTSEEECVALGDPIDGKFLLLKTVDGEHWAALRTNSMPAALANEGAFAASNSCLVLSGEEILFGTGGASIARVFHSQDGGLTWAAAETPIAAGNPSSGIFSLAIGEDNRLLAVGGDYKNPDRHDAAAAYSTDNGKTWQLGAQQPGGYRSAVACLEDALCAAVGPSGEDIDVSMYMGERWKPTDPLNLNALAFTNIETGWAVGPKGTIARFVNLAITRQFLVLGDCPWNPEGIVSRVEAVEWLPIFNP
jgi:photosystem II stability/assembly factor-like uncharacterized protein